MIGRDLLLSSRYGLARRADPAAPTASDPSDARYAVEATLSIADRTWREAQQRLGIVGGLVIGMAHASPSAPSQNVALGGELAWRTFHKWSASFPLSVARSHLNATSDIRHPFEGC